MMQQKIKIHYEARFKKKMKGSGMAPVTYKKDQLFNTFKTMKQVKAFLKEGTVSECHGHGVYDYFNAAVDFYFVKVTKVISISERKIKV